MSTSVQDPAEFYRDRHASPEIIAERQRLSDMLKRLASEDKPERRLAHLLAAMAVRRGRLLTDEERLQNLATGLLGEDD